MANSISSVHFSNHAVKHLDFKTGPVDYFSAVCLWADSEIQQLRKLKRRIQRESSMTKRKELEVNLRVRVQRYVSIVGQAMAQLRQDPKYLTLSPSERVKVSTLAVLHKSNQAGV